MPRRTSDQSAADTPAKKPRRTKASTRTASSSPTNKKTDTASSRSKDSSKSASKQRVQRRSKKTTDRTATPPGSTRKPRSSERVQKTKKSAAKTATAAKRTATKRSRATATAAKTTVATEASPKQPDVLALPKRMSLRALEKAALIRNVAGPASEPMARVFALGAGYTLAILGAATALTMLTPLPSAVGQWAQVSCATSGGCLAQADDPRSTDNSVAMDDIEPVVQFVSAVPPVLAEPVDVRIETLLAAAVTIVAENIDSDERVTVATFDPVADSESFSLDPSELAPGRYQLRTETISAFGSARYQDTGPEFSISEPSASTAVAPAPNTQTSEPDTSESSTEDSDSEPAANSQEPDRSAADDEQRNGDTAVTEAGTTDATIDVAGAPTNGGSDASSDVDDATAVATTDDPDDGGTTDPTATVPTDTPDSDAAVATNSVAASTPGGESLDSDDRTERSSDEPSAEIVAASEPGSYLVRIENAPATYVELYAVRLGARRPTFLGAARTAGEDTWVATIGASMLPVGSYDVYARLENNGSFSRTPATRLTLSLSDRSTAPATTTAGPPEADTGDAVTASDQYFQGYDATATGSDPTSVAVRAAAQLLESQRDVLEDQLQRYASALRADNDVAISRAEEALEATTASLSERALRDPETADIANRVDSELTERLTALTARVKRYEAVLAERDTALTRTDSDSDGIADADERALYGTDPRVADSDGDGVTDGVEITGGFDPTDPAPERRISYGSPKEVGVVDAERLRITEVAPVIERDAGRGTPPVQARITGQALPESYVTLFIYSSPVIATVRTDADGSFTYTLTKDMVAGPHEVYVALTDNSGAVVAKSEPYEFVKREGSLTRGSLESDPLPGGLSVPDPGQRDRSYYITLALVVLALGLVLIVIGQGLLGRRSPGVSTR